MAKHSHTDPAILFEDNHCLVVNKPARMLTASDRTGDSTLLSWCRAYNEEAKGEGKGYLVPIHFLDRPVSGVVIFAKSSKAAARLNLAFKNRKVEKEYEAICEGIGPVGQMVVLKGFISKDRSRNISVIRDDEVEGSKHCELSYAITSISGNLSSVIVKPVTGRSHQIRCQMSHAGLPLYGDQKYGARSTWVGRIALHARSLSFPHPISKEIMTIEAPLPIGWMDLLNH